MNLIVVYFQMVVGMVVNYFAYRLKTEGYPCQTTHINMLLSATMYTSYLILFSHFFYKAYFARQPRDISAKKSQ